MEKHWGDFGERMFYYIFVSTNLEM